MEGVLLAVLKGGELVVDVSASVYERLFADESDADESETERTDETR